MGITRTLILMSTEECIEVWNPYIVHLKLIQQCLLTVLELRQKISFRKPFILALLFLSAYFNQTLLILINEMQRQYWYHGNDRILF